MTSEPAVGSLLGGKYVIEGILGRGGMGVVYAARHRDLDQRVAIKCLLPHALAQPEVVERFAREARAAAKIQGEHVARVIDVGRFDDGTPFMVMEHLQGHDLADQIAKFGPLAIPDAVRYLLETCEALAQAHALRIVHRDLKPSNLFLAETPGRRPIVKVLDFGISKVVDSAADALTKTASVMGTPYYMSPEQLLSSKSVDERSDVWALGIILYELLHGQPPFVGETAPEVIAKIVQNAPDSIRNTRPDVPAGLEAIIARCIQSKPAQRFANVAELASALAPYADPADRDSVNAIARVLGVDLDRLPISATGPTDPVGSAVATSPTLHAPAPPARASSQRPPVAATAADLSVSSASVPRSGKAWVAPVALAALVAVAGAGVLVMRARPAPTATALPAPPSAAPTPSASAATTAALEPLAPLDPGPSAIASDTSLSPPTSLLAAKPTKPGAVPPPPQTSASAPPPPSPPPAAPPPPPPAATSHNPLDLQIK